MINAEDNVKIIEKIFKVWKTNTPIPADLFDADLFKGDRQALREKGTWIFDRLAEEITAALQDERKSTGRNSYGLSWLNAFQADFQTDRASLKAVSALYHLYIDPDARHYSLADLSHQVPVSVRQFQRYLHKGYLWVAEILPPFLDGTFAQVSSQQQADLYRFIPRPAYKRLFGVEGLVHAVYSALRLPAADGGSRVISIEGLGGIGKTALARETAIRLGSDAGLAGICWVSAKQEWINAQGRLVPLLKPDRTCHDVLVRLAEQLGIGPGSEESRWNAARGILSGAPFLVVVDNLETIEDSQALLGLISSIKGSSRFLLTSRQRLSDDPIVQTISVPELSEPDSLDLLRDELARHEAGSLEPQQMAEIFHLAGGLPLALKLIAAQLMVLPFDRLVQGLRSADRSTPEAMYSFIYQQSWKLLDADARNLLVSLIDSSPDGETLDWVWMMSGLTEDAFESGLRRLQACRLVEKTQTLENPVYRIHRLTATFLQTKLHVRWDD